MSTEVLDRGLPATNAVKPAVDHSRIPELDGIRAIAIWMVLIAHVFYGWSTSEQAFARIPGFVMQAISHGWLGVDLFFILSGFLITGILLDSREKPRYFRNFYARRFLRIMPLYFAVVFVFFICYSRYHGYFILSTLFAANLANIFNVGVPHGPGVLWSLAVEEHFYLLWPLLVYLLDRKKLATLAVCIIALTPVARGVAVAHGMPVDAAVYSYSWFRFDGLALGGLLALWVRSPYFKPANSYRFAGLLLGLAVLITVIGIPFGIMHKSPVGVALRFTQAQFPFAAFFLVILIRQGTLLTAFLRTSLARLSGNLSYCLYLIHLALGDGYQALVKIFNFQPDATFGALGAVFVRGSVVVSVSFAIAMLSKRYLEEPFLRLKRYF
jgi:peptidoglycan/LPS O-acetylase OafA/YrhL